MPNANIINRLVGAASPAQGALVIPSFNPSGTSAAVATNQLGNAALLSPAPGGGLALGTTAPQFAQNLDGFAFKVRLVFKLNNAAGGTVIVGIQQGNSATASSNTTIAATNAGSASGSITGAANGWVEAILLWDNVSQRLGGRYEACLSFASTNTYTSPATLLNSPPYTVTAMSSLQFVPFLTPGTSLNTTLTISEFIMETI